MNAEYLQIARRIELQGSGAAPANEVEIALESGTPYRHVAMYLMGEAAAVTAQPLFGEVADGAPTAVAGPIATKIYQGDIDEIRPATRSPEFTKIDAPFPLKTSLKLTNTDINPAVLSVYIVAAAAPGGA